jgi:hypothetical protein
VRFADIQPAFANRDPKLYFVPEGVHVVHDLPTIPKAGIKVRRQPPPPAPAPAKPQTAPQPRQPGGGQPVATSGQQPRSARDVWVEKADQWHKDPISLINDTLGKYERLRSGERPASFVDPEGWNKFLEKQEAKFHAIVAKLNARSE